MNNSNDRTIARAVELTDELARLISSLRSEELEPAVTLVDTTVLHRLGDGLGGADEVLALVSSYGNGLGIRTEAYLAAVRDGDDVGAQRMLIDIRSSSELLGALGIAAWCRRRATNQPADEAELLDLVERTRRELTLWRLTFGDLDAPIV